MILSTACLPGPPPTETFTPAYLRFRVCEGAVQTRQENTSEWTAAEEQLNIRDTLIIAASSDGGATLCIDDDSRLSLLPGAVISLEELRPLPRLQIAVETGEIRFETDKHSYELTVPGYALGLIQLPASLIIEVEGARTHLMIEDGTVTSTAETGTLRLFSRCEEVHMAPWQEPEVSAYCQVDDTNDATMSPTSTGPEQPTALATATRTATPTRTPTASPTATATPTVTVSPTPTLTAVRRTVTPTTALPTSTPPPTATDAPPPPPPTRTAPPPTSTSPPPTDTPLPPTNTPLPPPTDTPAPPTRTPEYPTPTPEA